jgi:hypothetical protein
MRRILLLMPLLLSGCYYPYGYYPYGYYPYGYYGYGVYPYPAQPPYYGPAASDPNNCGTPDEPKSCYHAHY